MVVCLCVWGRNIGGSGGWKMDGKNKKKKVGWCAFDRGVGVVEVCRGMVE